MAAKSGVIRCSVTFERKMMKTPMTAFEMTGTIDEHNQLRLDGYLPIIGPKRVRVIVLLPIDDQISEAEWLKAAAKNPAFEFLHDAAEDIYTLDDGKPFNAEI
jgi:hypothetical protein